MNVQNKILDHISARMGIDKDEIDENTALLVEHARELQSPHCLSIRMLYVIIFLEIFVLIFLLYVGLIVH